VIDPRDRLIVALDVADVATATALVARIGDAARFYKIGYQLGFAGGLALAERLAGEGHRVFLDLKLHDIGHTVARGVESVARLGVSFLTVHAYPQTVRAAVEGRGGAPLQLLAVTVLTSWNDADCADAGYAGSAAGLVARKARQAVAAGIDGLVASAEEAARLRALVGATPLLVTPGIRPAGSDTGDQKRVVTPGKAIADGVDHLVVGRPIVAARDPRAAALAVQEEIANALAARVGG
jgi:orotidine-5'-phosphate decarboxylase